MVDRSMQIRELQNTKIGFIIERLDVQLIDSWLLGGKNPRLNFLTVFQALF